MALAKLFDYIKNDMFVNKSIIELSKLNEMLKAFVRQQNQGNKAVYEQASQAKVRKRV